MNTADITRLEPLEDWVVRSKPAGFEDWEWHKFLCGIARIYLVTASAQLNISMPELLRYLSVPDSEDLNS